MKCYYFAVGMILNVLGWAIFLQEYHTFLSQNFKINLEFSHIFMCVLQFETGHETLILELMKDHLSPVRSE